eukprot:m.116698 g.116698  ORF g.116698 m.116698 type:complete len:319 (+) comp37582_c0_seq18:1011-1967(+)
MIYKRVVVDVERFFGMTGLNLIQLFIFWTAREIEGVYNRPLCLFVATSKLELLASEIRAHLADGRRGERLREGVRLAIIGKPNVGKSSLLNILTQRPAAIVSPLAGTTRDVVETALNISGYPVIVSDTAGLRKAGDAVEREGVKRALEKAQDADLILFVIDSALGLKLKDISFVEVVHEMMPDLGFDTRIVTIVNKMDLTSKEEGVFIRSKLKGSPSSSAMISCMTGFGIDGLLKVLEFQLKELCGNPLVGSPSLTQSRHRQHLQECLECLDRSQTADDIVLAAEETRLALNELGRITGQVGTEDVLDVIFTQFCIGK